MRALVTGGSGFAGKALAHHLRIRGYSVVTLSEADDSDSDHIQADVTDRTNIMRITRGFETVYHLAGLVGTDMLQRHAHRASMVNIIGTINVLDGAICGNASFVYVGKPDMWLNTYTITKVAGESFVRLYIKEFGLKAVALRWFNVYGPGQSASSAKVVPSFVRWAVKNESIQIYGSGEQTVDLVNIVDACNLTIDVANCKSLDGRFVDIGRGIEVKVKDLANTIIRLCGSKSKLIYSSNRSGEIANSRSRADLRSLASLDPKFIDLESGLLEVIWRYKRDLLGGR